MKKVYVVAWEYNTGGGFDWYHTEDAANQAFKKEKLNCDNPDFSIENWTAAQYEIDVPENFFTSKQVTNYIDKTLCDDFEKANKKYKATIL